MKKKLGAFEMLLIRSILIMALYYLFFLVPGNGIKKYPLIVASPVLGIVLVDDNVLLF